LTKTKVTQKVKKITQELLSSRALKKFVDTNLEPTRTKDDINKVDLKLWEGYEEVGKMDVCPRCKRDDIYEEEADTVSSCPQFTCECGLFWVGTDLQGLEEGATYTSTVFNEEENDD